MKKTTTRYPRGGIQWITWAHIYSLTTLALVTSATGQSDSPTELAARRALARHVKQALDSGRAADLAPFGFDEQFGPGDFITSPILMSEVAAADPHCQHPPTAVN